MDWGWRFIHGAGHFTRGSRRWMRWARHFNSGRRHFIHGSGCSIFRLKPSARLPMISGVMIESATGNVGQTSCLPVQAASCRLKHGARMPREPSGWKPDPHSQTRSESALNT